MNTDQNTPLSADSTSTLNEILAGQRRLLADRFGDGEARDLLREVMFRLKGFSPTDIALHGDAHPSSYLERKITEAVERLIAGEPVQYIFGKTTFHGLELEVTPDVLIPRPETSQLVDLIVDSFYGRSDLQILDLCTGSGCIAIALARNLPFADVVATDISAAALEVARRNAAALKAGVKFVESNILTATPTAAGVYDIVVSNPPYVLESEAKDMDKNVVDHEPHSALFVPDANPLEFYRPISRYALEALKPGGMLWLEINPLSSNALEEMLTADGWEDVKLIRDSFGKIRFANAKKQS